MLKHPEPYVCHGCGTTFMRRHPMQTACNPKCYGTRLTPEDQAVIRQFKALCKRNYVAREPVFVMLTGRHPTGFYNLQHRTVQYTEEKKNWYIVVFRKFIEDFRDGWYKVSYRNRIGYVERQQFPLQRHCPRSANMCKGGFNAGDCPRKWNECSLSKMLPPRVNRNAMQGLRVLKKMGLLE